MVTERQQVFISYSHSDIQWLDRLTLVLAPLVRGHQIDLWDDRRIPPGAKWGSEINEALYAADVAVLLVSASFLASDFINQIELPSILEQWRAGQLSVVWVSVSPALYEATPLNEIQAANDPRRPLNELSDSAIDAELVRIARLITSGSAVTAVGRALRTVDDITYQLADIAGIGRRGGPPSVVASPVNGTVELHRQVVPDQAAEVVETITAADLSKLTDRQRQLIETFEASMYVEFDRWSMLYPRRVTLTDNERKDLRSSAKQMCNDLTNIINFLAGIGKNLQDHYVEVGYICSNVANM